jgi:hypothetical protein
LDLFGFPHVHQDLDGREIQHWRGDDGRPVIHLGREFTPDEVDHQVARIVCEYRIRKLSLIPLLLPLRRHATALTGTSLTAATTLAVAVLIIHVHPGPHGDEDSSPYRVPTAEQARSHVRDQSDIRSRQTPRAERSPRAGATASLVPDLDPVLTHPIRQTVGKHPIRSAVGPHPIQQAVGPHPIRAIVQQGVLGQRPLPRLRAGVMRP